MAGWTKQSVLTHNRNAVAAFSPALDDEVGLRWVVMQNGEQP